jgi:hypothetical protein
MAYFSNSSECDILDSQCSRCKYGQKPCPIALAQMEYNYDQCKDETETASKVLNTIVDDKGCVMFRTFKDLKIDPNQTEIQF